MSPLPASFSGKYRLTGVFGVGSTLSLKKDGSFAYALTYGALEQKGTGCWMQHGADRVALVPDGESEVSNMQTLSDTNFRGVDLETRDDGTLIWNIADSGRKAVYKRR